LISKVLQPGESMNFNNVVSPFSAANGYKLAPVLKDGETKMGYGGGSCQVSSTLWDSLMQLPGITVLRRNPHGANAASYLPHGMDAASGTDTQNFIFRNDYDFPIRIDASTHDLALFVAIYKEEM
jgi:vancomycin resistance protein YoaR